jgi:hypothetical protein
MENNETTLAGRACVQADIQTCDLQNSSQKHYCISQVEICAVYPPW